MMARMVERNSYSKALIYDCDYLGINAVYLISSIANPNASFIRFQEWLPIGVSDLSNLAFRRPGASYGNIYFSLSRPNPLSGPNMINKRDTSRRFPNRLTGRNPKIKF